MNPTRLPVLVLWICTIQAFSQKNPFTVSGNFVLTQNGIDPVPSFALGKPALMTNLFVNKGRFTYNHQLNYSITDLKPWAQNNWLLYRIPTGKKSLLRVGGSWSFFFKRETLSFPSRFDALTQIVNQYAVTEVSFIHNFSDNTSMTITNWAEGGLEWDAVPWGNFTNLAFAFKNIKLGKNFTYNFFPSSFLVINALPFKGVYCAEFSSVYHTKFPIGLVQQTVIPIWSDPKGEFNWNVGIQWRF